jgi:DNA end-binding protein Ku
LAGEGYVVIRDALKKTGRVGLAQVTIGGREWLVAIAPMGEGLVMEMLRYAEELRDPADFFTEVPKAQPQKGLVDLAVQLIEQTTSPFKPEVYRDHYQDALKQLVQEKMRGHKIVTHEDTARPTGANIVDLMEALKRSVGQAGRDSAQGASAAANVPPKKAMKAPPKRRKTT